MTYEEAIKNINALNAVCGQKDLYDAEFESALALAIEALEKQIPKKPIVVNDDIICPNCSATLIYCLHTSEIDYCDKCGQRLDWSEEYA